MDKIPVTAAGYARMEAELKNLKSVERPAVISAIAEAREHGDIKENAEYHSAKEKQSFIEGRIKELEATVSRAEVIDIASIKSDIVKFGATVTLADDDTGDESTYQIVGEYEADLKALRISLTAPLARALIGKKVGANVEVTTPKGTKSYEILAIKYI
jgi:transcription elongation factor GreA